MARDDKPALVALALILVAILALAALEIGFRNAVTNPASQQSAAGVEHSEQQNQGSEGHVFGSPISDWLMVLLTGAATGISAFAVILVNKTLKASRDAATAAMDAVQVTREIAERQFRPMLVYESATSHLKKVGGGYPDYIELHVSFRNCGLSPCIITAVSGAVYAPGGETAWVSRGGTWQAMRLAFGPNHAEKLKFKGDSFSTDGTIGAFAIGILICYTDQRGAEYEEIVWLTVFGKEVEQGDAHGQFTVYRPDWTDSKS